MSRTDITTGCWVAYYNDMSSVRAFGLEVAALRYAVEHSMSVRFVPWGDEIRG